MNQIWILMHHICAIMCQVSLHECSTQQKRYPCTAADILQTTNKVGYPAPPQHRQLYTVDGHEDHHSIIVQTKRRHSRSTMLVDPPTLIPVTHKMLVGP
jgi:hypothetical protein